MAARCGQETAIADFLNGEANAHALGHSPQYISPSMMGCPYKREDIKMYCDMRQGADQNQAGLSDPSYLYEESS